MESVGHYSLMEVESQAPQKFRVAGSLFWLVFFVAISGTIRCHNFHDIFIGGKIYFVDADCYSRMTRARMVTEHPATIIRHHDFENAPHGIAPHTTMPMDWMIAIADCGLRIVKRLLPDAWRGQTLDLAGAWISPLLGIATVVFVWFWARRERYGAAACWLVALSPMLVQGTLLGRPDHQSLLIFLLAVAIGAEVKLCRASSRGWGIVSGAAWGLAFWVSLYEPMILFVTSLAVQLVFCRGKIFARERWPGFAVLVAISALALLIEGWRVQLPDAASREFLSAWLSTVGEMQHVPFFSTALLRWCGLALLVTPVLLAFRLRPEPGVPLLLALLAVSLGFTWNQERWGYFLVLVFAMSLPCALSVCGKKWIVWSLFALSFWPVAADWEATLFPADAHAALLVEKRIDNVLVRDVAERLKEAPRGTVLAPWWFSPALAYWSGDPCVAGSSHESMPGIADTARFYLAETGGDAMDVLKSRDVRWVIVYDWRRVARQSANLFSKPTPPVPLARVLDERPHSAPDFLKLRHANQAFKIFEVANNPKP